jgi:hypothetical protein
MAQGTEHRAWSKGHGAWTLMQNFVSNAAYKGDKVKWGTRRRPNLQALMSFGNWKLDIGN